jgi:hypothetical protein
MGDGRVVVAEVGRSALASAREITVPGGWVTAIGGTVVTGVGNPAERANRATGGELAQPGGKPVPAGGAPEPAKVEDGTPRRVLAMDPADHVLVVTSRFRFLLISWRQLQSYSEQGVSLAEVERLAPEEKLAAIARWETLREFGRLVLITSKGFARWYRLEPLRAAIEGPNPFQLDHPAPGVPVDILGSGDATDLVVFDEAGHGLRTPTSAVSVQGSRVLNVAGRERARLALAGGEGREILLLTADGYGKRVPSELIPSADKPNSRGRGWLARRIVADACLITETPAGGYGFPPAPLVAEQPATAASTWIATSRRLLPLNLTQVTVEDVPSLRTQRLVKLASGEQAGALLQL